MEDAHYKLLGFASVRGYLALTYPLSHFVLAKYADL
jgi:hypothetical protein